VTSVDVRRTNWWYVLPPVTGAVLVIGDDDHAGAFPEHVLVAPEPDSVTDALRAGPYDGVAVPDLDRLIAAGGSGATWLAAIADGVKGGGWLYVGSSNDPVRSRGISVAQAQRVVRRAGFDDLRLYLAAPDHVTPAYLISAIRRAEVDFFLRVLFFPYSRAPGTRGAAKRSALRFLRLGASVSPPWLRARAWPSLALVARRRTSS